MTATTTIDLSNHTPEFLLQACYNSSRPLGLGITQFRPGDMTKEEAAELVRESRRLTTFYFDYVYGRPLKIELDDLKNFNPWLYERDNGSIEEAIARQLKKDTK
jgi:hypothetical protein